MKINKLNYVDEADRVIRSIGRKKAGKKELEFGITTSKIRNILAMVSEIYNEVVQCREEIVSSDIKERMQYLKMRIAYEAGRDKSGAVRTFVEKSEILALIDKVGDKKEDVILYCRYVEALVAYHRFHGGKDS